MSTQKMDFDGTLYFMADKNSHKIDQLRRDAHVNLAYSDPEAKHWVSVAGVANVSRDQANIDELWSPFHKAWFPGGKEDPNIVVIRVDVDSVEYWDTASSKMVQAAGFLKAIVTGEEYHPGDNKQVNLNTGTVEDSEEKKRTKKDRAA